MIATNIYLDWNCGGCDNYLDEVGKCCTKLNTQYTLTTCDVDPIAVFTELKRLRSNGHVIEYLPMLVISNNKTEEVHSGILDRETVKNIFKKYE